MKKLIIATCIALLPLSSIAALSPVADSDLGNITGQAGVSIAIGGLDLDATIGNIQWTDTDADGGTVSINGIAINALTLNPTVTSGADALSPLTIDVVNVYTAVAELGIDLEGGDSLAGFVNQGIVRVGLPTATLGIDSVTIASITVSAALTGASTHSFGAVAINDVTATINSGTVYIFAH